MARQFIIQGSLYGYMDEGGRFVSLGRGSDKFFRFVENMPDTESLTENDGTPEGRVVTFDNTAYKKMFSDLEAWMKANGHKSLA